MTSPNLCHRCGNSLEENAAFCPQCGAPQIRVTLPETGVAEVFSPSFAATITPANKIQWTRAFLATFLPALGAILLLMVNPFFSYSFFVWIALAGYVSVALYRRRAPGALIQTGTGVRLGAVVGLLCFVLQIMLIGIGYLVETAAGHDVRAMLAEQIRKAAASNPNPEAMNLVNQFLNRPEAFLMFVILVLLVLFVGFLLSGILGGALGGASQARHRPQM
jgi:hypothetical protein